MSSNLFEKYDQPVPRYTSYPTVPYWSESPTRDQWIGELKKAAGTVDASWSLYLHIPYCETLCTFCGCNTVITKDHDRESPYVSTLLKEFELYLAKVPELAKLPIKQLHLGGGTPTFLSAANLKVLLERILGSVSIDGENFEASIEVDPRRTNEDQLEVLRRLGFNRISMGVQDFNEDVQKLVNRVQPFEITADLTRTARQMGYESVNFDLIYGLPMQTLESMKKTVDLTIELRPDRIALYSFALVPWIKPAQRLFKDEDLPKGSDKRALYELARSRLVSAGYVEIGMDHFALPTDSLAKAAKARTLHRNFMGYTDHRTSILLGLGVSAISETPTCFHQNEKVLTVYERNVLEGLLPTFRGHLLSEEDQQRREQILRVMTEFEVSLNAEDYSDARNFLSELERDQLVQFDNGKLKLTANGRPFLRNVCLAFDKRLRQKQPETKVFSKL
jgi:oxygen-independent coproporphyrinogen III oxidase